MFVCKLIQYDIHAHHFNKKKTRKKMEKEVVQMMESILSEVTAAAATAAAAAAADDDDDDDDDDSQQGEDRCNCCLQVKRDGFSPLSLVEDEDNNFWIQCDHCDEWYHGRYVVVFFY